MGKKVEVKVGHECTGPLCVTLALSGSTNYSASNGALKKWIGICSMAREVQESEEIIRDVACSERTRHIERASAPEPTAGQ